MINAFYSGRSGILNFQQEVNIVSNNIANTSTPGFKSQNIGFSDLLYTNVQTTRSVPQKLQSGNGMRVQATPRSFEPGELNETGRTYDAAVIGDGFFAVMDGYGQISYTRQGNFSISNEGNQNYLVTADGDYVLDNHMKKISLGNTPEKISFVSSGETNLQNNEVRVGIYSFRNREGLTAEGDGKFKESASSGNAQLDNTSAVRQGSLERSNVDLVSELQNLMLAQRGFEFSSNVVKTVDEMEQIANNLR